MALRHKILSLLSILALLPSYCFGLEIIGSKIQFGAELFSFFNLALFITSLICIKQFFWPGDNNRMPFHVFNIVFVLLFYSISLPFLIHNKQYYVGYSELTPISILGKFFFSINISSFSQWLILASLVINVLYIRRYYKDYFEGGVGVRDMHEDDDTIEEAEENIIQE